MLRVSRPLRNRAADVNFWAVNDSLKHNVLKFKLRHYQKGACVSAGNVYVFRQDVELRLERVGLHLTVRPFCFALRRDLRAEQPHITQ